MARHSADAAGEISLRRPAAVRARWRKVLVFLGWLVAVPLATLGLLWFLHADSIWWIIYAAAGAPWLCALACVGAVSMLFAGLRALACVYAILAVLGIIWLAPQLIPLPTATAPPDAAAALRIFDANVEYSNSTLGGIAAEITRAHPDVVTLEELTSVNVSSLAATGALAGYRWHFVVPDTGSDGIGVWSDIPLTGAQLWFAGSHPEVSGWLAMSNGARVRLFVVHTIAPGNGSTTAWMQELAAIGATVRQASSPRIVVGDFNATGNMYEFQRILHAGLSDTAVKQGKGWEMTWSRQIHVLPPLVRIDHILYSRGITSTSYRTGEGSGSDHRPMIADLAVSRPG